MAIATETIKAVVIDGYPARALWVKEFTNFFIPEVDKRLAETGNYKIDWQESYGGSIVKPKGVLEGIKLGLGDIGIVTTIFHSSKLPSQAISAVTPFIAPDSRAVAKAVDEIAKEFPTMQKEFEAQNQVYLATGVVLDTYQMFSKDPINSLAEGCRRQEGCRCRHEPALSGRHRRCGRCAWRADRLLQHAADRLVDNAMLWPEAAKTFKIAEVAPYMLKADLGAVNSKTDHRQQGLLGQAAGRSQRTCCRKWPSNIATMWPAFAMDRAAASLEAYVESRRHRRRNGSGRACAWAAAMPNIAVEWAANLDAKGEPGSDMLKAYMAKLKMPDAGARLGRGTPTA